MTLAEQDRFGCRIGVDYPAPVVDHKAAVAFAKEKLYALRRGAEARAESRSIVKAHGSRKKPGEPSPRRQRKKDVTPDLFQSMEGFTDAS
jgi:deoxyribodipyrimidine photo-lyase